MKRTIFEQGLASLIAERLLESRPWATFLDTLRSNGWMEQDELEALERELDAQLRRAVETGQSARVALERVAEEALETIRRALERRPTT